MIMDTKKIKVWVLVNFNSPVYYSFYPVRVLAIIVLACLVVWGFKILL